jgi:hypothetical protein
LSNLALFATNQRTAYAIVTAANPIYAPAKANMAFLFKAGLVGGAGSGIIGGSLVSSVTARTTGTISDAQVQLWTTMDDSGATPVFRLLKTAKLPGWTLGTATPAGEADFGFTVDLPERLAPGEIVYAGSAVALANNGTSAFGIHFGLKGSDL